MRRTKMGLLCRSQAATAVCAAGDPRSMVVLPVRPNRSISEHRRPSAADRHRRLRQPVTLPMLTKTETDPSDSIRNELFQVVVMRVSIHCQGCAGKVRKLISKMEGVTSYSIDLESKRVTVMGHVSPVGVLESISKVKKAEFWSC